MILVGVSWNLMSLLSSRENFTTCAARSLELLKYSDRMKSYVTNA
jgi:hypothetical protein